ncbi:hypothetical protein Sme01_09080 [Sphaerisporangium melleum]|uniref:Uncharacterized protein n=1 Tax=Sphaerisporangium melleum TaxID=321316 RepID=A0A917VE32_9ACTN|nr:hypothetical protein [Sphaerisporangium melleum]GGK67788.1 hypothetical protein GCM10007964_08530 [Sphaerisporangium melleum]GII68432.1 hypothetical protein Sme01_09080 [Sphaerisporangium melleum]
MIEDDLREALRARARSYETDPHAWAEVQRRVTRARRVRWAALAAVPLCAAALVAGVPLVLSHSGPDTATTTRRTPPASLPLPDPSGRWDAYAAQVAKNPPVGGTLAIVDPSNGRPIRLWFTDPSPRQGTGEPRYIKLCAATQYALHGASVAGCPVAVDPVHDGNHAWYAGSTSEEWPNTGTLISYGMALPGVADVAAVGRDGSRLPGLIYRPKGAPAAVWTVTYPAGAGVGVFEFTGSDGRVVQRVTPDRAPDSLTSAPAERPDAKPAGGLVARLHEDGTLLWLHDGEVIGATVLTPGRPIEDLLTGERPADWRFAQGFWFGLAKAGTAKAEVRYRDGRVVSARAVPDPWKRGFTLFAAPAEHEGDVFAEGYTITLYNAHGRRIGRVEQAPNPPFWADIPLSTPDPAVRPSPR